MLDGGVAVADAHADKIVEIAVGSSERGRFLVLATVDCNGISTTRLANYEWSIPVRFIIHLRLKLRRDMCDESRGPAGGDFQG